MSVLIKGMTIPPNCFMCNLSYMKGERLFCSVTREEVIRAKRAIECPIIEIPPHGDLIDRDALIKSLDELCNRVCQYSKAQRKVMCGACPLGDAFTVIEDDAPAILEAEVKE